MTKKELLIAELLKGQSITEACQTVGISRKTYYKWLDDKTFSDELRQRKQAIMNDCVQFMRNNFKTITQELLDIINNPKSSPQIKINAINSLFQNHRSLVDIGTEEKLQELEYKLSQIERMIENEEIQETY